jgi:hypothetical protein
VSLVDFDAVSIVVTIIWTKYRVWLFYIRHRQKWSTASFRDYGRPHKLFPIASMEKFSPIGSDERRILGYSMVRRVL